MNQAHEHFDSGAVKGDFKSYLIGFLLSLELTLAAYWLVVDHGLNNRVLMAAILCLAIIQLMVQLIFFLHLDKESKPHWNLMVFGFMAIVLIIIVFGSLWIMSSLNYHMDNPHHLEQHIIKDEGY